MIDLRGLVETVRARLEGRALVRYAITNSAWLIADRFYRMFAAMLTGVLIARYLGPTSFGWLSFATAAVAMITAFTELGINAIVVRDLVREPRATNEIMGTALTVRACGASLGLTACLVVALSGYLPTHIEGLLTVVLGLGLIFRVFDLFDLLLQVNGSPRVTAWIRISATTIVSLLKIALVLLKASVVAFAAATTLELVVWAAGWWRAGTIRGWQMFRWRLASGRTWSLLRESWPLTISVFAVSTQAYMDQLLVGSMLGSEQLGQYAAAMRLVNVFAFLPVVVNSVLAPVVTRAKVAGEPAYLKRLHDVYRVMMFMFLFIAVPLVTLGPAITRILYGKAYGDAAAWLPWLTLRLFFANFGIGRSMFITNERLFRFSLLTAVAGGITNVAMNLVLLPRWGVPGAIVSSFISFAVTIFALEVFDGRARDNLRLMLSAALMPWRPLPV
jgi:O-antigen/teichoic acid export membrane protein